jgi:hypothetical protein
VDQIRSESIAPVSSESLLPFWVLFAAMMSP